MIYKNQCVPPLFSLHGSTTASYPPTPTQLSFSHPPSLPRNDLLFFLTHNPHLFSFYFSHVLLRHFTLACSESYEVYITLPSLSASCPCLISSRLCFFHLHCRIMYKPGQAYSMFGSVPNSYQFAPISLYLRKRPQYKDL